MDRGVEDNAGRPQSATRPIAARQLPSSVGTAEIGWALIVTEPVALVDGTTASAPGTAHTTP